MSRFPEVAIFLCCGIERKRLSRCLSFTIPAGDLATGTDTLTAIYNGDASNSTYGIATGTATVIVTTSSSTTTFVVNSPIPVVSPTTIAPAHFHCNHHREFRQRLCGNRDPDAC